MNHAHMKAYVIKNAHVSRKGKFIMILEEYAKSIAPVQITAHISSKAATRGRDAKITTESVTLTSAKILSRFLSPPTWDLLNRTSVQAMVFLLSRI
jgi:hypothetical protein